MEYIDYSKKILEGKYGKTESTADTAKATIAFALLLVVIMVLGFMINPSKAGASSFPDGCTATTKYSATTGYLCTTILSDCNPGDLFSATTGQSCAVKTVYPPTQCEQAIIDQKAADAVIIAIGKKYDSQIAAVKISNFNQLIKNDQISYLQAKKAIDQAAAGSTDYAASQRVINYCYSK